MQILWNQRFEQDCYILETALYFQDCFILLRWCFTHRNAFLWIKVGTIYSVFNDDQLLLHLMAVITGTVVIWWWPRLRRLIDKWEMSISKHEQTWPLTQLLQGMMSLKVLPLHCTYLNYYRICVAWELNNTTCLSTCSTTLSGLMFIHMTLITKSQQVNMVCSFVYQL